MTGEDRLQGRAKIRPMERKDKKIPPINEGQKISGS
jgi:hypothetical protein